MDWIGLLKQDKTIISRMKAKAVKRLLQVGFKINLSKQSSLYLDCALCGCKRTAAVLQSITIIPSYTHTIIPPKVLLASEIRGFGVFFFFFLYLSN